MSLPRGFSPLCCVLPVLCLVGCGKPAGEVGKARPIAGDTVTPVLLLGNTWVQEGPVLLSVRLQVQGADEGEAKLLQLEDVPYEIVPRADFTFYNQGVQLNHLEEVPLARDC